MATLGNPKNTIEIIQKYGFNFQKKFGQNFLIDTHVLDKIIETVKDNVSDKNVEIYVVQEGVSYGSTLKTKSVFDLAGLNFMIRERFLKDDRFHLTIATPSEIKKYSSGNGNCKKEVMIDLFKILYPDFDLPKLDDICDAYFMASYAKYLYDKEQTL